MRGLAGSRMRISKLPHGILRSQGSVLVLADMVARASFRRGRNTLPSVSGTCCAARSVDFSSINQNCIWICPGAGKFCRQSSHYYDFISFYM